METYEELVWRKPGEERCDWTPMPTEKKALAEQTQAQQTQAQQTQAQQTLLDKELEEPYKEIQSGINLPIIEGVMAGGDFPQIGGVTCGSGGDFSQIGGVACGAGGDFPQRNLEPIHTRGLKSDTRKGYPERYLVGQAIQNPFMPNSNYANDLEVQMNFLTPIKG